MSAGAGRAALGRAERRKGGVPAAPSPPPLPPRRPWSLLRAARGVDLLQELLVLAAAAKVAAMSGCISFQDAPLEHEDQMRIMFDAISVTNETSFVPSSGGGVEEVDGAAGGDDKGEAKNSSLSPQMWDPMLGKGQLPVSPRERRRRLLEICMSGSSSSNVNDDDDDQFMVAYAALECMGLGSSGKKKTVSTNIPFMSGIQWVEVTLEDLVECFNVFRMRRIRLIVWFGCLSNS
ncbi:hypothetical protein BAE44_0005378 [Dichanthelium oligosanthes]|uniref:Uncharacterized protein n=1 Tax=Dichanthelium oligosanthes TaxID=888268 RepID=A0A1E5W884_9POAL|nr:hypothetical protein BAE44_0005378 [Dichanthelium oligosanthes]